ncbi:MAG: hypothetical protein H7330_12375 [Hymenobacteraceae bacterium]|nr:hypothetical protein [Hymenobacteraceae bacterium]
MNPRLREWLRRYGPAEVLSVAVTLAAVAGTFALTHSRGTTALVGTWAGNVAYFGWILLVDIRATHRALRGAGRPYTASTLGQNLRALAVEFGPAEVLDSFVIRPALMYGLPIWTGSLGWGSLAAKFAADITFYLPTILSYELSKKRLRRFD